MRPFRSKEAFHRARRSMAKRRRIKRIKPWDYVDNVQTKKLLKCSLLNVDGLNEASLNNVETVIGSHGPDIVVLLETKRRVEEHGIDISMQGYSLVESRRSNNAGDRDGGGIAIYTKLSEGILFKHHKPDIADQDKAFVNSERVWITVQSQSSKTAICGMYLGCQYSDDRYSEWNDSIYQVVQQEAYSLRSKGFRIVYLGDFNGHIGNNPREGGIPGNTAAVNNNGRRLLNFVTNTDSVNVNGLCRVTGDWNTRVCNGLWTRQRGGSSSVIDYALISREHANSVVSMLVDDTGSLGGGSDHNWILLNIADKFVIRKRRTIPVTRKEKWNITEDQDWSKFMTNISEASDKINGNDVDSLASEISTAILKSLHDTIGLKATNPIQKPRLLPPSLVNEIRVRDQLGRAWKSLNSSNANQGSDLVSEAEQLFNAQRVKVADMLYNFRSSKRSKIIQQCSGTSTKARRSFWSYVSPSKKQTSNISAVINPTSGVVKCDLNDILIETENHLINVFNGSLEEIPHTQVNIPHDDHPYAVIQAPVPGAMPDHSYSVDPSPSLPSLDASGSLDSDPGTWLNRQFSSAEVKEVLKCLKNGKACGWDQIPNEALKNLPDCMVEKVTKLFNKIKSAGKMPKGWNRGRVTLVHKKGQTELLGNYRPITVLVSLSGLYSKLLNERLIKVTEKHKLLGELQNGFRKGRCGADNNFVLNTILWKSKALRKPVHMAFIDISKAYDSVNREILWEKLASLGFSGDFLASLKALYTNDCVDCVVNGLPTRPIFQRRGLRQGCALSPLLFALYIMDVGNDINLCNLGFNVGNVCISGLLFADDLVILGRSAAGLKSILSLVKTGFDKLKLTINVSKSQVVSPASNESWEVIDDKGLVVLTLEQVELYKYLGTWTYSTMHRTALEKQRHAVKTAYKYKSTCIHVSRMGPDVVDVVLCTWSNIAIPAILTGCEMITFCESRISEIERIQVQIAKFALGVPSSCPNVCAQTELGLKPFRQLLMEHQLKFYFRALYIHKDRLVHQALLDHLSGAWPSPYLMHIAKFRGILQLYSPVAAPSLLKSLTKEYFLAKTNLIASSLEGLLPLKNLARARHVCENEFSSVISQFKLECAGLGNKQPRTGHLRKPFCPACPTRTPNTGAHLLFECGSVSTLRRDTGIQSFLTLGLHRGLSRMQCFSYFVNGLDTKGQSINKLDYLERGKAMNDMREKWLSKWL